MNHSPRDPDRPLPPTHDAEPLPRYLARAYASDHAFYAAMWFAVMLFAVEACLRIILPHAG